MSNIDANLIEDNEWGYSYDDYYELMEQEFREKGEELEKKEIVEIIDDNDDPIF